MTHRSNSLFGPTNQSADESQSNSYDDPGALDRFRSETTEILCCACGHLAWFNRISWTVSCPTCRYSLDAETYRSWRDTHVRPLHLEAGFPATLPVIVEVPCPLAGISGSEHFAHYMPEQRRWSCTTCDLSGGAPGFGRLLAVADELSGVRAASWWAEIEDSVAVEPGS